MLPEQLLHLLPLQDLVGTNRDTVAPSLNLEQRDRVGRAAPGALGAAWMEVRRKGGKVHRVALPDDLRTALLRRCHARSGYVFGEGKAGEPPTQQTASNRVIRAMEAVGLDDVSHHTMRHTGVTLILERGINPRVIQFLAGWTSLRMLDRYGHVRDTEIRRAVTSNAAHVADAMKTGATPVATAAKKISARSKR